jgi:hypothetical protein
MKQDHNRLALVFRDVKGIEESIEKLNSLTPE